MTQAAWDRVFTIALGMLIIGLIAGCVWLYESSQSPNAPVTSRMKEETPGHIGYPYNGITAITIHSQGRVIPCIVASQTVAGSNPAVGVTCDWSAR